MSDLDNVKYEGNLIDGVKELLRRVEALERRGVNANSLDEFTDDIGDQRAGRFLAMSSGVEPTDPDASGVFMSAAGETFGSDTYNIGGVENGSLQFGLRSTDGVGVFSGGDAEIGTEGISINRMGYLIQHTATDGTTERTGSLGMWAEPGGTAPQYGIAYSAPADETELVTNGTFEAGDFTGWTKTTETNGTWSLYTQTDSAFIHNYEGSYTAWFWAAPTTSAKQGVLTSDRIAVDESTSYQAVFAFLVSVGALPVSAKVEIKWYDDPSAGSLLSTDTLINKTSLMTSYQLVTNNITSPSGSQSCEFVITTNKDATGVAIHLEFLIDSISLKAVSISSSLYFDSTGELCLNGNPILPKHCYISGLAVESNATLKTSAGNPSYKYTTVANANNGDTYTYQVPPLAAGTYSVYFCGQKRAGAGKVDWTLDGTSIVTGQDWYASSEESAVFQVDSISITSGAHELTGKINGKNASSTDYALSIYSIVFVKTA